MHVLIIDDHVIFREGLIALISQETPDHQLSQVGSLAEASQLLGSTPQPPDLVLLDLQLGTPYDEESTRQALTLFSGIPVVVLSGLTDPGIVRQTVEAGAMGFIPKCLSYADFSAALARALAGEVYLPRTSVAAATLPAPPRARPIPTKRATDIQQAMQTLTPRQLNVLRLLAYGWSNRAISRHLFLSENTVKTHLSHIFLALEVNSRAEAVYLLAQVEHAGGPPPTLRA